LIFRLIAASYADTPFTPLADAADIDIAITG
jgi:hypothetical protein